MAFVLLALLTLIASALGIGLVIGAAIGLMIAITAVAHGAMAIAIWTRRPPTFVWFSRRWWAALALFLGLFAAVPFAVLHYRRGVRRRCLSCGYDQAQINGNATCSECGECA